MNVPDTSQVLRWKDDCLIHLHGSQRQSEDIPKYLAWHYPLTGNQTFRCHASEIKGLEVLFRNRTLHRKIEVASSFLHRPSIVRLQHKPDRALSNATHLEIEMGITDMG